MIDWQVTATTIYCDAVDDDVTLMVHRDGLVKCTGDKRYSEPGKETSKLLERKSKQLNRKLACEGLECYRAIQYRDKLFAEEAQRGYDGLSGQEKAGPHQGEGMAKGE
ncbi:hypothetical protein ACFLVB_03680 [Chloroflexota bacterium]